MRSVILVLAALLCLGARTPASPGWHLIPGQIDPQGRKGPDGNSIFLDAPQGLILVDTGRHPEHSAALLAYARARGRPIAAIFNTHWHLDHSTGNTEIRAAFPHAPLYASTAIEGALTGFLARSRESTQRALAAG
jgi:glyoxylase-like metal-dependent hydrolase (beta-lactamase superfamily II)